MRPTNGNATDSRLEKLRQREAEIRARIAVEQERRRKREEREAARLFMIVGEALTRNATGNPTTFGLMVRQVLDSAVTDTRTREFLRQKGML